MKNFQKIFEYSKEPKSFTLVETMVALSIIMIAILGPVSVAVSASSYARDTKNNFTATYLAQEAVELLRHKRDGYFLKCTNDTISGVCNPQAGETIPKETAWRLFKTDPTLNNCFNPKTCAYDVQSFLGGVDAYKYQISPNDCDTLYRDDNNNGNPTNFMYFCKVNGTGFTSTNFTRSVQLEDVYPNVASVYTKKYEDDIRVTVDVTYPRNNGVIKKVEVIDFIHSKS